MLWLLLPYLKFPVSNGDAPLEANYHPEGGPERGSFLPAEPPTPTGRIRVSLAGLAAQIGQPREEVFRAVARLQGAGFLVGAAIGRGPSCCVTRPCSPSAASAPETGCGASSPRRQPKRRLTALQRPHQRGWLPDSASPSPGHLHVGSWLRPQPSWRGSLEDSVYEEHATTQGPAANGTMLNRISDPADGSRCDRGKSRPPQLLHLCC